MPSVNNNSPASAAVSSAGYATPENPGSDALFADLIARSEAAADYLLANTDWAAHDALVAQLIAQSERAADALLADRQHDAFTQGTSPCVQSGTGTTPT